MRGNRIRPDSRVIGSRPARSVVGLALAGVTAAVLTGCSTQDAICGGEEYPVLRVASSGSACAPKGEEPPKGYARYPEGKVPEHVGDKWDTYWETHSVDKDDKTIKLKDGQ
ncbi:hypothetical protein [Streptomyces sp. NPDC005865]|uniref:SCO0607 family lipoprotein n=1 Tax=Streptomyces sp. NPDC005865 TaxID=3155453 RepID=UPI00340255C1